MKAHNFILSRGYKLYIHVFYSIIIRYIMRILINSLKEYVALSYYWRLCSDFNFN